MMNKNFKFYAGIWAIGFAIFGLATFLPRIMISGAEITLAVIVAFIFSALLFVVQLGCGYYALKENNLQKVFYNIPIIRTSFTSLIIMVVVSVVLSLVDAAGWLVALVCAVITLFSVVSVLKANFVSEEVAKIDEKIKLNQFFIKNLTVDAETLMSRAQNETAKAATKKVYEAVRYSDPMSNDGLSGIESEITIKFNQFVGVVSANGDDISTIADELLVLINDRNKRCKLLK